MVRGPFAVRVVTGSRCYNIGHLVGDSLTFGTVAPYGFGSCQFNWPKSLADADVTVNDRVIVDDTRNGRCLHDGYLAHPGKANEATGHEWQVTSVGGSRLAADRSAPYVGRDQSLDGWETRRQRPSNANASAGSHPNNEDQDVLLLQFSAGAPVDVAAGSTASMQYLTLREGGQLLGGFQYSTQSGTTVGGYGTKFNIRFPDATPVETVRNFDLDEDVEDRGATVSGDLTLGADVADVLLTRNGGATNVTTDDIWTAIIDPDIRALLYDKNGDDILDIYGTDDDLTADLLFTDIVRLYVPGWDLAHAVIEAGTHNIDQFAYVDPVRAEDLFTDLLLAEPGLTWLVWERSEDTGKHRVELKAWADGRHFSTANPRYVFDDKADVNLPGGEVDPANRIAVSYRDKKGRPQVLIVTRAVRELEDDDGNVERWVDAPAIPLGAEIGSEEMADRIGTRILAAHNQQTTSGTIAVRTPVVDRYTGLLVQPWELLAGETCIVGPLTAGLPDEEPVLRITETNFADGSGVASLTVGTPPPASADDILKRFATRRRRPRNRR